MIAPPALRAERVEPERPPYLEVIRCTRCGNGLGRVYLVVGSVVTIRCHHSIRRPDGKRETCGMENTARPTR